MKGMWSADLVSVSGSIKTSTGRTQKFPFALRNSISGGG